MPQIAVIGLGRFGTALVHELERSGATVFAVDVDPVAVDRLSSCGERVFTAALDATDLDAIRRAGFVTDLDAVVVAIGENFEATQVVVLRLMKLGVPRVIARAQTAPRRRILQRMGVREVLSPEIESAKRVGYRLLHPLVVERGIESIDLDDGVEVASMSAPAGLVGKTLMDSGAGADYSVLVVRIRRKDEADDDDASGVDIMPPAADETFRAGDLLTVVGRRDDILRFAEA